MIAIYARQSIEKKDSLSIDGQIELCKRECSGETSEYIDSGFSGKNTDRPSFKRLIADVENGLITKVVVYRLDRISRSITDFGSIWETFNKHNVEFVSINEKFDTTTPMGRAMIYIIMVFAQLERETIAERVKDNYYQRAKSGAYLGGAPTYGFDLQKTIINNKSASMLVTNDKINIVKEIFDRYAYTSDSLGAISKWLKELGIPCTKRETWDNVSLSRMLHNPSYVKADPSVYLYYKNKGVKIFNDIEEYNGINGLMLFGKRDRGQNKYKDLEEYTLVISAHKGVIDSKTFLKCQEKLDKNSQLKNTGTGKHTWMSGLMKCGKCGYSMRVSASSGRKHKYITCSGKTNFKICDANNLILNQVESEVSVLIQERIDLLNNTKVESLKHDNNDIKNKIAIIDEKIQKLVDSLTDMSGISAQYVNKKIADLDYEKNRLLETIIAPNNISDEFEGIIFNDLDFEQKRFIAKKLINKISMSSEKISVEWAF